MGLLIVLVLLIALEVAVSLCGHDSRDGRDWKRTPTGEAWPMGERDVAPRHTRRSDEFSGAGQSAEPSGGSDRRS